MNVLFRRLLRWLAAMGTSVVLLSATLPARTRRLLLEAYSGRTFPQDEGLPPGDVEYPAITWATTSDCGAIPIQPAAPRTIQVTWLDTTPGALVGELRRTLREGGCAAVLCNTVGRAQDVFKTLCQASLVPDDDLFLFHARFPFHRRQEIERQVLAQFGKQGDQRPSAAIVVATQVIEQSLDLDFDLMITELAPTDLILQRAGRLHRHVRPSRPTPVSSPRLIIIQPALDGDVPQFGSARYVYAPYILLRSYLTLRPRTEITVPADVQPLIEAVYGPDEGVHGHLSPPLQEALDRFRQQHRQDEAQQEFKAKKFLILPPDDEELLDQENRGLEEDRPELHQTLQALTRDTRPSVTLVCLHQTDAGVAMEPDGETTIDLALPPDEGTACELAQRKVTVSDWRVLKCFAEQEPPAGWSNRPMLPAYRPAIFTQARCDLDDNWQLVLDPKLGLTVEK